MKINITTNTNTTHDITPTWRAILPLLVYAASEGATAKSRKEAMDELYRIADIVDAQNAQVKPSATPVAPVDRDALHRAFTRMSDEGGGFARKLAAAWFHADRSNKERIEAAFDDLIQRYTD